MSVAALVLVRMLIGLAALATTSWIVVRFGSWRLYLALIALGASAACASIWLYSKRAVPPIGDCAMPSRVGELGSICGYQRPEDLELLPSQNIVLASEERTGGRLMGLRVDDLGAGPFQLWPTEDDAVAKMRHGVVGDPTCLPPDASSFAPQGLSVSDHSATGGPIRVAVVAHVGRETIQFFDFVSEPLAHLSWRGCIFYPEHTTGNDVALLSDGSLVATNFLPEGTGEVGDRYRLRGSLGLDTGDVLAWSSENGWTHVTNTNGAMPNGIIASRDESTFYFADAGNWRVAIVPTKTAPLQSTRVRVGGAPDNLTLTRNGTILATVVTLGGDLPFLCSVGGRECRLGWAVWEVDPQTHVANEVLENDGKALGSATTALEVGKYLFIGTMVDDRIGVYRRF
jgi:hypothetical protein